LSSDFLVSIVSSVGTSVFSLDSFILEAVSMLFPADSNSPVNSLSGVSTSSPAKRVKQLYNKA
jgi:hypothetical protein